MPCFSLKTFILAETQPQIKNKTSHSELVYIWQSKGKPTPLIHFYRKVQSSTEQYYNLMSLCGLAMTLMVSLTSPPPREGQLTSVSWNWLKAQTAPRCQQERPLSGRLSTICSMVTVPFSVGGGQRIVGGALGIQEHQSYCTTKQENTLKSYRGLYLGRLQRKSGILTPGSLLL